MTALSETRPFIALDWGTTSFRAYLVDGEGVVTDQFAAPEGILAVKDGKFEGVLESHIGSWDKALPVIASGMITSRQGWVEVAYAECPAGAEELARSLHRLATASGRKIHFITGLHYNSPTLLHDVLRGEETQVVGELSSGAAHFVAPGTHSKWIDVAGGQITQFASYMTGESFALYRHHSILGRLMTSDKPDSTAFKRGVEKAFGDPAGLLHLLFSTRTLGLFNAVGSDSLHSYLSGLLIGAEVAHATRTHSKTSHYVILASKTIGEAYETVLTMAGLSSRLASPQCGVVGQRVIAKAAGVI